MSKDLPSEDDLDSALESQADDLQSAVGGLTEDTGAPDELNEQDTDSAGDSSADASGSGPAGSPVSPAWSALEWAKANKLEAQNDREVFDHLINAASNYYQKHNQLEQHNAFLQQRLAELQQQSAAPATPPVAEKKDEFTWDGLPEYHDDWQALLDAEGKPRVGADPTLPQKIHAHNAALARRARDFFNEGPDKHLGQWLEYRLKKAIPDIEKMVEERVGKVQRLIDANEYLQQNRGWMFDEQEQVTPQGQLFYQYLQEGIQAGKSTKDARELAELKTQLHILHSQQQQQPGEPVQQPAAGRTAGEAVRKANGQFAKAPATNAEQKRQELLAKNTRKPSRNGTEPRGVGEPQSDKFMDLDEMLDRDFADVLGN